MSRFLEGVQGLQVALRAPSRVGLVGLVEGLPHGLREAPGSRPKGRCGLADDVGDDGRSSLRDGAYGNVSS